jgi:hypothetical protein
LRHAALALLATSVAACGGPPAPADELGWLVGAWTREEPMGQVSERWERTPDGQLLGVSWVMVRSDRRWFLGMADTLHLRRHDDKLELVVWQAQGEPTVFPESSRGADTITFSRGGDEFPTAYRYAKQPDGTLFIEVQGPQEGKPTVDHWSLSPIPGAELADLFRKPPAGPP